MRLGHAAPDFEKENVSIRYNAYLHCRFHFGFVLLENTTVPISAGLLVTVGHDLDPGNK